MSRRGYKVIRAANRCSAIMTYGAITYPAGRWVEAPSICRPLFVFRFWLAAWWFAFNMTEKEHPLIVVPCEYEPALPRVAHANLPHMAGKAYAWRVRCLR